MLHALPLQLQSFVDEPEFYCAVLRIPPDFSFSGAPLHIQVRLQHVEILWCGTSCPVPLIDYICCLASQMFGNGLNSAIAKTRMLRICIIVTVLLLWPSPMYDLLALAE